MLKCNLFAVSAVSLLAAQFALPAAAGDAWDVRLTPYLWAMGIDGDFHVRGHDFNSSADFSDIMDNMDIGGSVMLEANKGNWVNLVQFDYLAIDSGDVELRRASNKAQLKSDSTLGVVATGVRFHAGQRSTIDALVGVRYIKLDTDFKIQNVGEVDGSSTQYDGVVMLRPRLALSKYWTFSPTLSVGAGDSDLVWEMAPEFVYDCCGTEFRFGYRNLNYDLENGNDSADISISGPVIGVGFAF
ncbi:MAG: hypothetical protein IPJ33_05090 [Gammaproteobacteria bacterium]|jgi:hypothetical protein|nr:hypothetical protein [Gammaproteobacteria bacterium]MBP6050798.1 hypothetical protein [Pseudomonadales bacterium]MBK6584414.1 hypothetical protein [Gammaproteobacteria bacterium]MBK7168348.1 hypothetical protein [Gammaproteobacteria bacterium]MBK7520873.1 hypothetical protein [Gammaproteobacteria bacterium]